MNSNIPNDSNGLEDKFEYHILTRLFPLATLMLAIYTPYSFFLTQDYLAGYSLLGALIVLIILRLNFPKIEKHNITKDVLIFLGFPVLIPWLISGGPENAGLWWAPIYVLWVSFFAKGLRYIVWLITLVICCTAVVLLAHFNLVTIAYRLSELLHILFAFSISSALIYFYELWRSHYKTQLQSELDTGIQSELRYLALLNSAPDAIVVANEHGKIILANTQVENIFGYTQAELINSEVELLLPVKSKSTHPNFVKQYFANPTLVQNRSGDRFKGRKKDGSEFPIELSLNLNAADKQVTAIIRDITKQQILTTQLIKQNRMLADFVSIASHDLRGPVGNLKLMCSMISTESSSEEKDEYFSLASKVVSNLDSTLSGLLEIVTTRETNLDTELLSFETELNKLLDSFASEISLLNAKISCNFIQAQTILYAPVYLSSMLQNLLSNSLKYHHPDRLLEVSFETKIIGNNTILTVADNGLGIDLEKYGHKIFGLNQTFHKNPAAKGFGLYLIKTHLDVNGGKIEVESTVNKGTTFTITFPNKL